MKRSSQRTRLGMALSAVAALLAGAAALHELRPAAAGGPPASPTAAAKAADESGPRPVTVSVEPAATGSVSSYLTATANLVSESDVEVLAETEGRVTRVLVEEGDRVDRGQLLAVLDREDAEIVFNKARLREENTRTAFDRAAELRRENLVAQQDFDRVSTDYRLAEQELAEARWRLDRTGIRAPFSGRLTQRFTTAGQHVAPGTRLFRVTAFEPLIARVYVPEQDVLALREGRTVRIALKADEQVTFDGRIRQISPVVDPATGTVKVTVEAARPPEQVRPGAFVTLQMVRETHDDAVLVARRALVREMQQAHVFVVSDGLAERREVTLGLEDGDRYELTSGVRPGEQVVVAGQGNLRHGAPVKVVPSEPPPTDLVAKL